MAKSGSFFSYGGDRLGQGRNNAKAYLDEHPEVAKEIESKIYDALGIGQDLVVPIESGAGAARTAVDAAEPVRRAGRRVGGAAGRPAMRRRRP